MLKSLNIKKRLIWWSYQKEIAVIIGASLTIFLALSLGTYSPSDSSWAYATTEGVRITNYGGVVGAQFAALFFYFFGSASLVLVVLSFFLLYLCMLTIPVRQEFDRIISYFVLMLVCATFCYAYGFSFWGEAVPGGLVGSSLFWLLHRWFDQVGAFLFLYTLLLVTIILITQLSFIYWIAWLKPAGNYFLIGCGYLYRFGKSLFLWSARYGIAGARWCARFFDILSEPIAYDAPEGDEMSFDKLRMHGLVGQADSKTVFFLQDTLTNSQLHQPCILSLSKDDGQAGRHDLAKASPNRQDERLVKSEESVISETYNLPNLSIFAGVKKESPDAHNTQAMQELESHARTLEEKLSCFGVSGSVTSIKSGPVVTLFEYKPDIDSKISKIIALEDDLALALKALSIRIIAPIPGRSVVGFEVSNLRRKNVLLAEVIQSREYTHFSGELPLILGQDTIGNNVVVDLARMPHLLVAGSTGSGKSVALNTMLISLLCSRTPDELRLILIDPKRLEFAPYAHVAHLLFPIVTEPKQAAPVLQWVVTEMETRYKRMAEKGARNCADYNKLVHPSINSGRTGTRERSTGEGSGDVECAQLPLIVVMIDELSDLMMTAGREIESLIVRITQMARAAGIHLIVATQRPSVDVITGLIKVNFPSRISFRVTSKIDSRTILDCSCACFKPTMHNRRIAKCFHNDIIRNF